MGVPPGLSLPRLRAALSIKAIGMAESSRYLLGWGPDVVVLGPDLSRSQMNTLIAGLEEGAASPPSLVWLAGYRPRRSDPLLPRVDELAFGMPSEAELLFRIRRALEKRALVEEMVRDRADLLEVKRQLGALTGRIADDMRLAANVQRSLLPPPLCHAQLELAREFIPFREIGGDYYDFIPLGNERVVLALGDVMGKGIPAALLAAALSAAVRSQLQAGTVDPEEVVTRVNRLFWELTPTGLFASLFFGVVDFGARRLVYVNAGHHYPFRVRSGGEAEDLTEGGPVLGLMEKARYPTGSLEINSGDVFVLYSDGVTDRLGVDGEPFGMERLKEAACRARADRARICLYSLLGEVQGWSGGTPADDDATLIVAKIL